MLRHSIKFLVRCHKPIHIRTVTEQAVKHENRPTNIKLAVMQENFQDRIRTASSTALTRYNEIIGYAEIEQAYQKVTALQESLHSIQNERSLLQLQISNVRSDLTNIQTEMHEHKRGEQKYFELLKKEFAVMQEMNKKEEHYAILDKKERELFSHLQAKINMLHDKSRTHTRQWGIIATVIGAALGIIGTSISAYYRNNDIRRIQQGMQLEIQKQISEITKDTHQITQGYNKMAELLQRFESNYLKPEAAKAEEPRKTESWAGYLGRKTVFVFKWCTFQKTS